MAEKNFFERLKENPRPVVVDFWAPWCGPCRMVDPVLKQLGKQYDGQVDVWKVNADEQPEVLRKLGINGIPTLIGFKSGQEILRHTGAAGPEVLGLVFEAALSGERPPQVGPAFQDRVWRLLIGVALLFLAVSGGFSGWYMLAAAAGIVALVLSMFEPRQLWQIVKGQLGRK